jgi:phosphoadenosine phosphosulfate reductase
MSRPGLATLVRRAAADLELAPAQDIVRWAVTTFGDRLCVASSMTDAVVPHLVSTVMPGVDVIFLDTGYHFAQTIDTRDAVSSAYDLNLIDVRPARTVAEQDAAFGPDLFARDPDLCCRMRKVAPLRAALAPYDAWVTGIRRDESPSRAASRVVSWSEADGRVKICPIARWTAGDVDAYVEEHRIVRNPLLSDGFTSVGCRPCTRRIVEGEPERAGRWADFAKAECGIH